MMVFPSYTQLRVSFTAVLALSLVAWCGHALAADPAARATRPPARNKIR